MPSIREKLAGKTSKLAAPRERMDNHPADLNDHPDGAFYLVEIEQILTDPNQPRKYFDPDSLAELSQSIKQKGVLQPVIIRRDQEGKIYLVAGERRFRAAKMAGLEKIPAILTKGNPMEIAMIENLQRENLKPVEEAEALARMVEEYDYTHEQLSFVIGKARSTITETLSLTKLPEVIKEECRRADIYPRRLLIEVAKQANPKAMLALFQKIKEGNLKSGQVREITRKATERVSRAPSSIALERIVSLHKFLKKMNLSQAAEIERAQLINELYNLKKLLDQLLS